MTKMPRIKRSDYACNEDYARAVWEAGGPEPGERYDFRPEDGPYSALCAGVWGRTPGELEQSDEHALRVEQAKRPHIFVRKTRSGRRGPRRR